MTDRPSALHSVTWLLWAVCATACIQMATNPLYVSVVLAVVVLVLETHRQERTSTRAFTVLLGVAVAFSLLRVVLVLLTTHTGGSVIVTLPEVTLPRLLGGFTVGGALEWTVLWTSLAEGFVVIAVMATFGAFNSLASHHELLQAMPRAFHEPGLVVTVALAFVPSTLAAIDTVREADRARTGGRVVRRGRVVRLVIPVLESGMERAVALAESMDSRGFGRGRPSRAQQAAGWLGLLCLLSFVGAMAALVGRSAGLATALTLLGAACLVVAIVLAPIGSERVRYRPRRLAAVDYWVLAAVAAAPFGLWLCSSVGGVSLRWSVTDPITWPPFDAMPAAFLVLLAAPALVRVPAEVDETAGISFASDRVPA